MRLVNDTERAIYAAAYVAEFDRQHALGVHAEFRRRAEIGAIRQEDVVQEWEASCIDLAIEHAEALVAMHRDGVRRRNRS